MIGGTTHSEIDFESQIDRAQTGSLKWEKYKGKDIIPFWVADMDLPSPQPVLDALHRRVDHRVFGYTLAPESATEAVTEYLAKTHSFEVDPEWIVWTPGLVPALALACRAYGVKGDAVMTLTPVYYPFLTVPGFADQELQSVPLVEDSVNRTWEIDFDEMERKVTNRTRLLIISNPHNPVGKVFSREEVEKLGQFAVKHDLILCSDEIHCDLILNDKAHICAGTLSQEIVDRTIIMMSPSKTYNLAGLACAYLVIPNAKVRHQFQKVVRGIITEVNCMGYTACEAAYRHGEPWRLELIKHLNENLQLIFETVNDKWAGAKIYPMDATYLAWIDMRHLGLKNPASKFEKFGIGLSEGSQFGGEGFVRLNFGCPGSVMEEGLNRMSKALAEF